MKDVLRALPSLAGPFPDFDMTTTPADPIELFGVWLQDAINAGIQEPHTMVLSTVDETGQPDARVLILKNLDARGWHFATTGNGPKGGQIEANPNVSLTFYWSPLGRQVRIRGRAFKADDHERDADFLARSAAAKANVFAGRQSQPLSSRQELAETLAAYERVLVETPDRVSLNWALFIVSPHEVEFWQGAKDRRHHRLLYTRENAIWRRGQLWP
ncbi:pyridoxal 5'-phosphate synthase [Rhizobium sp. CFBP 8762]|uniref:pyridoxine/pyridoxamine 5'-phosphate oxidase n=1 Tax=Rhizobium sp. CFBP 8762 TaxID=2775279 RepID=UPI00177F0CF8|nr:pyridoxal 5'-phosphate synthase [Rhizobium sp. CFBP 8762]MBD8554538.1 pyridoxal 5'-phosphate synthase [Rhizobium sp. CFBP 8762]